MSLWLACRSLGIALCLSMQARRRPRLRRWPDDSAPPSRSCRVRARCRRARNRDTVRRPLVAVNVANAIPAPEIYRGAAALKVTSGSTGLPKATFTREAQLVAGCGPYRDGDGHSPSGLPDRRDPHFPRLRRRQSGDAAAAPGDGRCSTGSVHPAATARRRDGIRSAACFRGSRSCLPTLRTIRTRSPGRARSRRSSAPAHRSTPSWRWRSLEPSA